MSTVELKNKGSNLGEESVLGVAENVQKPQPAIQSGGQRAGGALQTDEPTFVRAELFTHTRNDNKDHDTGIYVTVTTADGTSILARSVNADSSGTDATEYNDGSDHYLKLFLENVGATKSECVGFNVRIRIQTNGNDTWIFDAIVTLYFSDGTNLFAERDNITLVNNGATVVFSAPGRG